jgi:dTMP kinase
MDGSGKTSHASSLMQFLTTQGNRYTFVWAGFRPIFSYMFFGITRLAGFWRRTRRNAYTDPLEYAPLRSLETLGQVYRLFLFVDYQLEILIKVRIPLLLGRTVIADRYFYDMIMELQRSRISSERFIMILSKTLPQPLLAFLMDGPESMIFERRGFAYDELIAKRKLYLQLARKFGLIIVDSSKDFESNQGRIRELTVSRIYGDC